MCISHSMPCVQTKDSLPPSNYIKFLMISYFKLIVSRLHYGPFMQKKLLGYMYVEVRLIFTYIGVVHGIACRAFGKLKCDVSILHTYLFFTYVAYDRAFLSSRFLSMLFLVSIFNLN